MKLKKAVNYNKKVITEEMKYDGVTVLKYRIEYPEFEALVYKEHIKNINQFYRDKAFELRNYLRTKLYQMAVDQYLDDIENGFPIRVFEALQTFKLTFNRACIISLYFDNYEYTGGAHGLTNRSSQTWNLQTGEMLELKELFAPSFDYKTYIIQQVIEKVKKNPDIYFDNYEELAEQNFNENSFYCRPEGLVVYYQQYDIAPYSSGIREFLLPYNGDVQNPITKCTD